MQVSQGVEWALHICGLLARAPAGKALPRRTIAEFYALPEAYLAKALQRLVAAGVLRSSGGPRGGYRLARPAEQISALSVYEAIEGSAPAFTCTDIRRQGTGAAAPDECRHKCAVHALMDDAEAAWRARLARTSIAELITFLPATLAARQAAILGWPAVDRAPRP
ncbi:Rrf2 family protein [Microbacterium resistens]|uniref:Rrf2 family protein n=1 Tax=Microbacterium resistens TaxID=156977 RepID=A0ABU1S8W3_9MICO|nr:Rrf2 family transcriptional regulator [Microbacterium resistens]MDR6866053.1 Rrf2 family protein [Microbacterium resistens]